MIIDPTNPPTPDRMTNSSNTAFQECVRWPLTDGSGTTASEIGGAGQFADGTLTNGPTWNTDASKGTCVQFDGVDDYIEVDSAAGFLQGSQGIIIAWVYITATGQQMFVSFGKAGNANVGLTLGIDSSGYVFFRYKDGGVNYKAQSTVTDSSILNTWTHVAGRWQTGGNVKCFINGVENGSTTRPGDWGTLDQGKIGDTAIDGASSTPMTGKIQHVSAMEFWLDSNYMLRDYQNPWSTVSEKILVTNETLAVYDGK